MCSATANPLLALILTHSPVFAGWVGAASTAPALLMYLPAGWFVDRFDRRRLMFVSQAGRLAALALLVCALGFEWHAAAALLIATALCEGIFQVLYHAAEITVVQRVVDFTELPSALAKNETREHLALMAGKPLGGFLFGWNKALPYCMSVLTSIWAIATLWAMKSYRATRDTNKPSDGTSEKRSKISVFSGIKEIRQHHPFLRTVIVVCAVGNFLFQIVILSLVVLAERQHMSSSTIGLLLATSGIGGLAGSILAPMAERIVAPNAENIFTLRTGNVLMPDAENVMAPRTGARKRDERSIIRFCVATWALLTLVVAVSVLPGITLPAIGLIAWGCVSITGSFLNVAIVTYQARNVPAHMLGRVMGINRFLTSGAVPLGALSAGYIVAEFQPHVAAWMVFTVMALMLGALLVRFRPTKRLPGKATDRLEERSSPEAETEAHPGKEIYDGSRKATISIS